MTWVHLDQAGKAPVGEGRILGVHLKALAAGADEQLYSKPSEGISQFTSFSYFLSAITVFVLRTVAAFLCDDGHSQPHT